jgi:hypothetical protein
MKHGIWIAICTSAVLAACGGGGGSDGSAAAGGGTVVGTGVGTGLGTGAGTGTATGAGAGTGTSAGTSLARVDSVSAPQDGAAVNGTVQLAISGANLGNAELLPATTAQPLLGRFSVAPDGNSATLALDTSTVPNGPLTLRIAAYNAAPGDSTAQETPAMSARTWTFANSPSPAGNDAGRTARCQQMGFAATPPDPNDPVVCATFAHTSTPIAQCTSFGTGYGSPQDLLEVLRNGSQVSKLYCQPGANNGVLNPGCFCLS